MDLLTNYFGDFVVITITLVLIILVIRYMASKEPFADFPFFTSTCTLGPKAPEGAACIIDRDCQSYVCQDRLCRSKK